MSPLSIYKASAGSGKTFTLTLEYLKLLFRYPDVHRHILAVTFTNKAAGEMKQRILNRLHELSRYDGSMEMEEMNQLKRATGLNERAISRRAGELLHIILNDYSGFSVGTIDKFFQSVIRAFTREMGIQPGYNLELDHIRVLSLAVDRLFQDLSEQEDLQRWLIRFAEEQLEESRSWNFRHHIVQLGMQLFKESFQGLFTEKDLSVLHKENLDRYLLDLKEVEEMSRKEIAQIGVLAMGHLRKNELAVVDFRLRDNSPPSLFLKAAGGMDIDFTPAKLNALDKVEKWLNKSATEGMIRLTEDVLMPLLNQLYHHWTVLNTVRTIKQNFYTLGILGDLWEQIKEYTREKNLFLITDSSRFLRGIIGSNQVPFIYERTGNRYSHLMLDEFQDTSAFQYDNFRPLLDNALAYGNDNLVVGDIKQSIYRWRNSDWNLLASELEADFQHQEPNVRTLVQNYRSREQIIRFNNTVFQLAPLFLGKIIEEELLKASGNRSQAEREVLRFQGAYADALQQIPDHLKGTGGMVKMELFEEGTEPSFQDQVLERVPEWIKQIQESGTDPGDIAILVRSRKEGIAVANTLIDQFRILSSESLLLVHNTSVTLLIASLRYMIQPGDELNNALLKYYSFICGTVKEEKLDLLFDTSLPLERFLPVKFLNRVHVLKQLPLFELLESLITVFELHTRIADLPYLQALQDLVIDLHRKEPLGIAEFIHYWDQHGTKKGISISEASNAIRILTIHKAKGLEFKAVIVPFCNWEITTDHQKSNILWCHTEGTPFERIPTVPVKLSSKMKHTLFSEAFYQERMNGYMDNLNLLYVAFTRAKDMLYIGIPMNGKESQSHTGDLIMNILDQTPQLQPALDSLGSYRTGEQIIIGDLPQYQAEPDYLDPWQFSSYPVSKPNRLLKVRLRSDEYFVDEEGTFRTGQMYGNIMHQVFSHILCKEDIRPVLEKMEREGLLPHKERNELQHRIEQMITQPEVESWFTHQENRVIYNERSIFCGNGKVLRPDRVIVDEEKVIVIDFKFGEVQKESYRDQIRNYMIQMKTMGYHEIKGYIWYVMLNKVIQIELT